MFWKRPKFVGTTGHDDKKKGQPRFERDVNGNPGLGSWTYKARHNDISATLSTFVGLFCVTRY